MNKYKYRSIFRTSKYFIQSHEAKALEALKVDLWYCIEVNSSDFTTRAVVSQQLKPDSKSYPVVLFSKFLFLVK